MLFTQTFKSQNVAKAHSSGEETQWHNRRTCPDSGLHCGIGSHCLTDSCRKNEEEEEEEEEEEHGRFDNKKKLNGNQNKLVIIMFPSRKTS